MKISKAQAKHICSDKYVNDFMTSLDEAYEVGCEEVGEIKARLGYSRCANNLLKDYLECFVAKLITKARYRELVRRVVACLEKKFHDNSREDNTQEQASSVEVVANSQSNNRQVADGNERFKVGGLLTPQGLDALPVLAIGKTPFVAPKTIYTMDYCIQPYNQGDKPWCAAYAAAGFTSNVLWRKMGYPKHFDARPIYEYAKQKDNMPGVAGTTLVAVLDALMHKGYFSKDICTVKILRSIQSIRFALHKFGCCLLGLNVTKEWYTCNASKPTIEGKNRPPLIGGHAVLACGYDREWLIFQNAWGEEWGRYGFGYIAWEELEREFLHGAVLDNCLYDIKIN